MSATAIKLTKKQRERLQAFEDAPKEPKVVGYDNELRGPVLRLPNGNEFTITRDGGFDFRRG